MRLSAVESGARELANRRAGLHQTSAPASELPTRPQLAALGDKSEPVPHHRCDGLGRWMPSRVEGAGRLQVRVEICKEAYKPGYRSAPKGCKPAVVTALADTGAQMCIAGMSLALRMGLRERDLLKT